MQPTNQATNPTTQSELAGNTDWLVAKSGYLADTVSGLVVGD